MEKRDSASAPTVGGIDFGDFRRLAPFSADYGFDRGTPIDRFYIEEKFLRVNQDHVRGRVLEVAENLYIRMFGTDKVEEATVLHPNRENPNATWIADLSKDLCVPRPTFDCIIFTQTLFLIFDFRRVVRNLHDLLAPGGVLLMSVPGVSRLISADAQDPWPDYWRFTSRGLGEILRDVFPAGNIEVNAFGNVLTAAAFLFGVACEELDREELEHRDPAYELIICARATKPDGSA